MKNLLAVAVVAMGLVLGSLTTSAKADEHQHVRFTTYGHEYSRHMHNHDAAHQLTDYLESLGCEAHMHHNGDCYEVHYSCHGFGSESFECDHEAHAFANRLRRLGFRTQVIHH